MSPSLWAIKGFLVEDDSSMAVVETNWEQESAEDAVLEPEPEPEAIGTAWSESMLLWTAVGMVDREKEALK